MVNRDSVVPSVIEMPAKRVSTALFFTKSAVFRNKKPVMIIAMPANKEIWANFDFLLGDRIAIKSQAIKKSADDAQYRASGRRVVKNE